MKIVYGFIVIALLCSVSFADTDTNTLFKEGLTALQKYFKNNSDPYFQMAESKFRRILIKDPENVNAKMMLGMLYTKIAHNYGTELLNHTFEKKASLFQVGNMLLMQNRFADAVKCYEICNEAYPNWTCPFRHKGEALYKMGKYDAAIDALKKSIEIDEKHFDAYVFLADVYIASDRFKDAEATLAKAVTLASEPGCSDEPEASLIDCYRLYAKLYEKSGNVEKEIEYLKKTPGWETHASVISYTNNKLKRIRHAVKQFINKGNSCSSLNDLVPAQLKAVENDLWGKPYQMNRKKHIVFSCGADSKPNTADDIVLEY